MTTEGDETARSRWAQPGAFEVAAEVHRIVLPLDDPALRAVNVYTLTAPSGVLLIDGGMNICSAQNALAQGLAEIGHEFGDVRRILVTHVHADHYTLAVALRQQWNIPIALGAGEQDAIAHYATPGLQAMQFLVESMLAAGAPELARLLDEMPIPDGVAAQYAAPDEWLRDGQLIEHGRHRLRVLATPGHTRGHVVIREESAGLLFSGDHLLPLITPSIGFEPVAASRPLADFLTSLRRLRVIDDLTMLPAHGPAGGQTHARIDALLRHHDERFDRIVKQLGADGSTAFEIASSLTWTRHDVGLHELPTMHQVHAVREVTAHLDVLVDDGRARILEHSDGGPTRYSPATSPPEGGPVEVRPTRPPADREARA